MSIRIILLFLILVIIALFVFVFSQISFMEVKKIEVDQKVLESAKELKEKTDKIEEDNQKKIEEIYRLSK